MAVLRMTTVRPNPEDRATIAKIFDQMNEFFARQKGFIMAVRFMSVDGAEMGRIGIWESEEAADAIAQMQHTMALRSQLLSIIGGEEREESLYEISATPTPLPQPRK